VTDVHVQVRGKKNLVIEKGLAGPIGLFVKFSTLQEYGVDKLFLLENDNVDSSQRNVVFIVRGEKAKQIMAVAGRSVQQTQNPLKPIFLVCAVYEISQRGLKVDCVDFTPLYLVSLDP